MPCHAARPDPREREAVGFSAGFERCHRNDDWDIGHSPTPHPRSYNPWMILEITADQIAQLNDTDLRKLVGNLCEREVRAQGHSPAAVTWGGHQNAADGGIDVRVSLPQGSAISGYVPMPETGFQCKVEDMPREAILKEMAPRGVVRPSIVELSEKGGAYVIVSSQGSLADTALNARKGAMSEAVAKLPFASQLHLEFLTVNGLRLG